MAPGIGRRAMWAFYGQPMSRCTVAACARESQGASLRSRAVSLAHRGGPSLGSEASLISGGFGRCHHRVVFAAQVWSTGCVGLSRNPIMVDCAHVDFGRTAWPVKGNFTSCEFLEVRGDEVDSLGGSLEPRALSFRRHYPVSLERMPVSMPSLLMVAGVGTRIIDRAQMPMGSMGNCQIA